MIDLNSLRIGIVSYTNAYPLSWYLQDFLPGAQLILDVPSKLGRMLQQQELDISILSSIELLRHPEYGFIPNLGICSDGEVKSVCLFAKKDVTQVKTVALDQSSLTSVTVIRILLKEYWGVEPDYFSFQPPLYTGLQQADAALTIGDNSFVEPPPDLHRFDVGAIWKKWTQLPFVYAVWITRQGINPLEIQKPFLQALEKGMNNVEKISEICNRQKGLSKQFFMDYFTRNIYYHLGKRELEGMKRFFEYAGTYIKAER
ncbi:MAG: menaquinone biosynthetic enzyme MqnA/MqnD family protein [bacterium]